MGAPPNLEPLFLNSTCASPSVHPMFISSTYRITGLHYNNGFPTLSAAHVSKLYLQNYRAKLHLWVSNRKCEQ